MWANAYVINKATVSSYNSTGLIRVYKGCQSSQYRLIELWGFETVLTVQLFEISLRQAANEWGFTLNA